MIFNCLARHVRHVERGSLSGPLSQKRGWTVRSEKMLLVVAVNRQTRALELMTKALIENNKRLGLTIDLLAGLVEQQVDSESGESAGSLDD